MTEISEQKYKKISVIIAKLKINNKKQEDNIKQLKQEIQALKKRDSGPED